MRPLNSPLEGGLRALVLLVASFPSALDLDRLVLLDYGLLHSADLGGPPSVLPPIPARAGELGIKRTVLDHGTRLMVRARLVDVQTTRHGIVFCASEEAGPFLSLLNSPLLGPLKSAASWAIQEFGDLRDDEIRARLQNVSSSWAEQFDETATERGPR